MLLRILLGLGSTLCPVPGVHPRAQPEHGGTRTQSAKDASQDCDPFFCRHVPACALNRLNPNWMTFACAGLRRLSGVRFEYEIQHLNEAHHVDIGYCRCYKYQGIVRRGFSAVSFNSTPSCFIDTVATACTEVCSIAETNITLLTIMMMGTAVLFLDVDVRPLDIVVTSGSCEK